PKAKEKDKEKAPARGSVQEQPGRPDVQLVSQQLVDPREPKKDQKKSGDNRPGRADMPVNITAFGNKGSGADLSRQIAEGTRSGFVTLRQSYRDFFPFPFKQYSRPSSVVTRIASGPAAGSPSARPSRSASTGSPTRLFSEIDQRCHGLPSRSPTA